MRSEAASVVAAEMRQSGENPITVNRCSSKARASCERARLQTVPKGARRMEAKKLKDLMIAAGFSQAELSARTNIAKSKLSLVINGRERAWPGYRTRISKALGINEDEILWPGETANAAGEDAALIDADSTAAENERSKMRKEKALDGRLWIQVSEDANGDLGVYIAYKNRTFDDRQMLATALNERELSSFKGIVAALFDIEKAAVERRTALLEGIAIKSEDSAVRA
jgi:transcriptional regulator with XRE-family HTH domain